MSETAPNNSFNVPPDQDFNTVSFQGSMQQVLQENIGNYVIVEFLIGTGSLISRQGILYSVATQFLVLYDEFESRYVVCDIFSVKFVTFLLPGYRPGQIPAGEAVPYGSTGTSASGEESTAVASMQEAMTPAQAAYAHTIRRGTGTRR
ncbi:MAG: hypothetical protein IJZ74_11455 [Clostridia bacterium]|nr:hypothetical protein [Clostridia bacterium]